MEALKHLTSLRWRRHNNRRICSCSRYATITDTREFTPKLESTPHAFTVTRIYRRIDVSPYNWLQQYNRKGDREAFHSVAFLSFFPSYLPSVLLFCKLQHWSPFFFSTLIVSASPITFCPSSSSFFTDTNPAVCRRRFSLSLSLSISRRSSVLEPKRKSINSPREIVTRNMEYWVRAKLSSSPPGRRRREWGTRCLSGQQQCHRSLLGEVVRNRLLGGSKVLSHVSFLPYRCLRYRPFSPLISFSSHCSLGSRVV